jgi:hypothetical protein
MGMEEERKRKGEEERKLVNNNNSGEGKGVYTNMISISLYYVC